ncbi:MAG: hypothetical protein WED10_14170 [Brumimicrobium sp.]
MKTRDHLSIIFLEFRSEMGRNPKLGEFFNLLYYTFKNQDCLSDVSAIKVRLLEKELNFSQTNFDFHPDLYDLNDNIFSLFSVFIGDLLGKYENENEEIRILTCILDEIKNEFNNLEGVDFSDFDKHELNKAEVSFDYG